MDLNLPKARVTIRGPQKRPQLLGRMQVTLTDGQASASRRGRVFASGTVDQVEVVKAKVWRFTLGETTWDVDAAGCGCG